MICESGVNLEFGIFEGSSRNRGNVAVANTVMLCTTSAAVRLYRK